MKDFLVKVVLIIVCVTFFDQAYAQSSEPEQEKNTQEGSQARTDNNEKQSSEKNNTAAVKKAPDKTFRPTEEISEDSPVPFPVDI